MQKRSGERHDEQSGWYHASGPTVLAGKAQGREPLKGCAGLCRAVQAVQAVQGGARRKEGCAPLCLPPSDNGQATEDIRGGQCFAMLYSSGMEEA